jgi:hypothetical protein
MLSSISWQEYWIALAISCFSYYVVVYLTWFRGSWKLNSSFQREKKIAFGNSETTGDQALSTMANNEIDRSSKINNTDELAAEACLDEINAFFENQKGSKPIKREVMFSLYTLLQKYPSLRNSEYKEVLNRVIATQSEVICSIHLSAEELKGVWLG